MSVSGLQIILFAAVVIGAIPLLRLVACHEREAKQRRISDRPDMGFDEFYNAFYSNSGLSAAVVCRLLNEVAEATGLPSHKLRPSDRFDRELAPVRGSEFGDGLALLTAQVEQRLKTAHLTADTSSIKTLGDFIERMGRIDPGQSH